ncbi:hypothetical protein GHT06_010076 [Daphnia sinensis]|uniref:Methyltransferase FkbM domain-containing protein n=1 Tax=Daphnia sinensis TaxID=1820382 RepID=A0AAD5PX48_9CRUS|nr:hypothetical protein GHT06_010076 [Daphnia sinensis]
MRVSIRTIRFYLLRRFLLPCLFLCLLYVFRLVMVNSIYEACKSIAVGQQQVHPTHLPVQPPTEELPPKYNLMEETYGRKWAKTPDKYLSSINCTVEYANQNKLQQDHPCVVQLIRKNYLVQPAPQNVPYQLGNPLLLDPSDGQAKGILRILRNQTNGFFIECGAYDGETLSNTLYMERSLAWTGLLIETDQISFKAIKGRNRKAFTSPVCLSTKPYPMEAVFNATIGSLGAILERNDEQPVPISSTSEKNHLGQEEGSSKSEVPYLYKAQCFPLYSMLTAVGRTQVDYFSLDIEGSELQVLKTIPWHKVDIRVIFFYTIFYHTLRQFSQFGAKDVDR